jgi:hypothetical protein
VLRPALARLTRTSGADESLTDILSTSDSLDQWSA